MIRELINLTERDMTEKIQLLGPESAAASPPRTPVNKSQSDDAPGAPRVATEAEQPEAEQRVAAATPPPEAQDQADGTPEIVKELALLSEYLIEIKLLIILIANF